MDRMDKITYLVLAIAAILVGLIIIKQTETIEQLEKRVGKLEYHNACRWIKEMGGGE